MWTSAVTRGVAAMVVGVALVPVASATAQTGGGPAADRANSAPLGEHHDQLVLRRDPEQAVPFDPAAGTDDVPVLHRDGSQAVPFVAEVGPSANSPDEAGFNWGDALIGAGCAYALLLVGAGAVVLIRQRRPRRRLAHRPA